MKIAILGYSGSGKSTLAKYLGEIYNIPILYLDRIQFVENWQLRDRDEAKKLVAEFLEKDQWVIDGNYTDFLQKERLLLSDKILILNFNRFTCLYRAIKRYFSNKNKTRESMAEGCKEKLDLEFIYWILYKGRDKAKKIKFNDIANRYRDKVTIIKNQKELDRYISYIKNS